MSWNCNSSSCPPSSMYASKSRTIATHSLTVITGVFRPWLQNFNSNSIVLRARRRSLWAGYVRRLWKGARGQHRQLATKAHTSCSSASATLGSISTMSSRSGSPAD